MRSDVAALLSGDLPAGVYRSVPVADEEATGAGWCPATVDGGPGRAGLLRGIGETLGFPSWYAANFDALADCLRDLGRPTLLTWSGWERLLREDHQAFHTALDVLAERCADPDAPAFAVLLPGPGPDLEDLPAVGRLDGAPG